MLGLWGAGVMGCQSSSELGLERVTVMDGIWVSWPWVPGVRLVLPYLLFWVVFFLASPFLASLSFWSLDRGLWFLHDVSSACFLAVLVVCVVFSAL